MIRHLSASAIASVAQKEFLHIIRDRRVLVLLLILPPLFTLIFGYAFEAGEPTDVPAFAVEVPPKRTLGDLAVAVAFQLARALKKAPRAIAQELADATGTIPGVARVVATPNG